MAPGDEYSAGGGGKLKLKGSKVSEGRVEKKKAKKAKKKESEKQGEGDSSNTAAVGGGGGGGDVSGGGDAGDGIPEEQNGGEVVVGKTDTERKYEETRRKRLQERLKREGVKTHKERVEELNKYLSGLSEHHDMPKIGPG